MRAAIAAVFIGTWLAGVAIMLEATGDDPPTLRMIPDDDGRCHVHMEPGLEVTVECLEVAP